MTKEKVRFVTAQINKTFQSGHVDNIKRYVDDKTGRDTLSFKLCQLNKKNGKIFITHFTCVAQDKKAEVINEWMKPTSHVVVEGKLSRVGRGTIIKVTHVQDFPLDIIELDADIVKEEEDANVVG